MASSSTHSEDGGRLPLGLERKRSKGVDVSGGRSGEPTDEDGLAEDCAYPSTAAAADLASHSHVADPEYDRGYDDERGYEAFDLEPRATRFTSEDLSTWVPHAKELASRIRFGHLSHITWWGGVGDTTRRPLRRLAADTGVYAFKVSQDSCQRLVSYLDDDRNYNDDGFLLMAGTSWPGYGGYRFVHAEGGVVPSQQERRTVRIVNLQYVDSVLKKEEMFRDLVQEVRDQLGAPPLLPGNKQPEGKKLRAMHVLRQDAGQQASFALHSDSYDLKGMIKGELEEMTTAIVSLSQEVSGMRVWGMGPVLYGGQGHGVAFPGGALHESLPRAKHAAAAVRPVWKVAMFFC